MNLYNLTADFAEKVAELEQYFTDHEMDVEIFNDTMESFQAPIEEKIENITKYMKSLEALADAQKLEAKRLSDAASANLKKAEWFKNYMADNLQKAGIKKLQAGVFALSFRKGSEVIEVDETKTPSVNEAPHLYLYQEPKFIGKTDLKKRLQAGETIPGVKVVRNPDTLQVK